MRKRSRMSRSQSKKLFHRTAKKRHRKNNIGHPMRGGIRL